MQRVFISALERARPCRVLLVAIVSSFLSQDTSALCRVVLNWNFTPGVYKHEKKSDLHQSIWPEGFYDVRPACSAAVSAC